MADHSLLTTTHTLRVASHEKWSQSEAFARLTYARHQTHDSVIRKQLEQEIVQPAPDLGVVGEVH